ncbi:MAG: DinB family protein [Spirochaetales bacterium]
MTPAQKETRIAEYLKGADAFDDVLAMPPALLTFRPTVDAWTIHEHVVHFMESDVAAVHRYRKAVAEPGGSAVGYDEEVWTPKLNYHATSLADSVALVKLLRRIAARHLQSIVDHDWTKLTYTHSTQGPVNLETWLDIYVDHVKFHRDFIERNRKAFKK